LPYTKDQKEKFAAKKSQKDGRRNRERGKKKKRQRTAQNGSLRGGIRTTAKIAKIALNKRKTRAGGVAERTNTAHTQKEKWVKKKKNRR